MNRVGEDQTKNKAYGSIFGAMLGDTIGSQKGLTSKITNSDDLDILMTYDNMTAQVTGESELAMCLMKGLIDMKGEFDCDKIASWYKQWLDSKPSKVSTTK